MFSLTQLKNLNMKSIYLKRYAIALLCLLTLGFSAQTFTNLGNGTIGNCNTCYPSPYGNWYGSSTHQMFVTAAELTAIGIPGGAQIKSIGFNILNLNGASPHQNWKMTVYTTSLADPIVSGNVSTNAVSTNTLSTYTGTVGWNQTPIAPFIWNGSDNLVIETCFYNPSSPGAVNSTFYTYNYTTAWTTTLTGTSTKCRYYYADNITSCLSQTTTSPFVPSSGTSTSIRPDMRFEWINPTPCTGAPPSNTVIAPNYMICPNTSAYIGLANGYTLGGLTYAWWYSTVSPVGPYSLATGTMAGMSTPNLTVTTYYQAVVTCDLTNSSTTISAGVVSVAPVSISSVPYYESFEGIVKTGDLPNCSWSMSNPLTCTTYTTSGSQGRWARTGTKFATFYYTPAGTSYFYTNGIHLDPGITYSASVWWQTEYYGYANWTDFRLLYGTSQTTTGLVSIASTNGPAVSNIYKNLSGTFQVPASGLYYVAIKATTGSGSAPYLTFDDLSITIPCVGANNPTVTLNTNTNTICQGDQITLTASGADSFTWSTGSNAGFITDSPAQNTTYMVTGTSTISMCAVTLSQAIVVNPVPQVYVLSNSQSVCPGRVANLSAFGDALNYTWSNSMSGALITVTPAASTDYTVVGTNGYGCTSQAVQHIAVLNNPTLSVSSTQSNDMCVGETQVLTAGGGASYYWVSSTGQTFQGSSINISPVITTVYTVTGTGANGCTSKTTINQSVAACTGLKENSLGTVNVFPTPTSGEVTLALNNNLKKSIWVTDVTGKEIMSMTTSQEVVKIDLSSFANGIYYVKVQAGSSASVVKVVKN
jgi:hypothetical protein